MDNVNTALKAIEKVGFDEVVKQYLVCTVTKPENSTNVKVMLPQRSRYLTKLSPVSNLATAEKQRVSVIAIY